MWILAPMDEGGGTPLLLFGGSTRTVGRNQGSTLRLTDNKISRKHCEFELALPHSPYVDPHLPVTLTDRSRHGTWVGEVRAKKGVATKVAEGDIITFGVKKKSTQFRLEKKPLVFCFSRIATEDRRTLETRARFVGAQILKSWAQECTHLITPKLIPTHKVLMALVGGVPIVNLRWLEDFAKLGQAIPSSDAKMYHPIPEGPTVSAMSFSQSQEGEFQRRYRGSLFEDRAFIWLNCTQDQFEKDTRVFLARRAKAKVHLLTGGEAQVFWSSVPPFAVINHSPNDGKPRESFKSLFPADVWESIADVAFHPPNIIPSAILSGTPIKEEHFFDQKSIFRPPSDSDLNEDSALLFNPKAPTKQRNTQEQELHEMLSLQSSAGLFEEKKEEEEEEEEVEKVQDEQPKLEWNLDDVNGEDQNGREKSIRAETNSQRSVEPRRHGRTNNKRRRRAARRGTASATDPTRRRGGDGGEEASGSVWERNDEIEMKEVTDEVVVMNDRGNDRVKKEKEDLVFADGIKGSVDDNLSVAKPRRSSSNNINNNNNRDGEENVAGVGAEGKYWKSLKRKNADNVKSDGKVNIESLRCSVKRRKDLVRRIPRISEIIFDFVEEDFKSKRIINSELAAAGMKLEEGSNGQVKLEDAPSSKPNETEDRKLDSRNNVIHEDQLIVRHGAAIQRHPSGSSECPKEKGQEEEEEEEEEEEDKKKGGGGLFNFKKFRGNKKAELGRKRAIARHVDFDLVVEKNFMSKSWIRDATVEAKVGKDVDKLMASNLKPQKRAARARGGASRSRRGGNTRRGAARRKARRR